MLHWLIINTKMIGTFKKYHQCYKFHVEGETSASLLFASEVLHLLINRTECRNKHDKYENVWEQIMCDHRAWGIIQYTVCGAKK